MRSHDFKVVSECLRQAVNHPIQGGGADIIFRAMVQIDKLFRTKYKGLARLLIQVHDSLIFEAHWSVIEEVARDVKRIMEQAISELDGQKFPVDLELCESWKGSVVLYIPGVTKEKKAA